MTTPLSTPPVMDLPTDPTLLAQQGAQSIPVSGQVDVATSPINPPDNIVAEMPNFDPDLYDLAAESHLMRLMKVLLGDAGTGQLRKRTTLARMEMSLFATQFLDIDTFGGGIFSYGRKAAEKYTTSPYTDTALNPQWQVQAAQDGSYKSRFDQFMKSINLGATPRGLAQAAQAITGYECDIYEAWMLLDEDGGDNLGGAPGPIDGNSYHDIEDTYRFYEELEGMTYADIEGGVGTIGRLTVGNVLTPADSSLETDSLGTWVVGTNCTIEIQPSGVEGGHSLELTAVATGDMSATTSGPAFAQVIPDTEYTLIGSSHAVVTPRDFVITAQWYDNTGSFISSSSTTPVLDTTSGWATATENVTTPGNAAFALMFITYTTPVAAEVHYGDGFGLIVGASESWVIGTGVYALPGVSRNRSLFIVAPRTSLSREETFILIQVLSRLKPAGSLMTIAPDGIDVNLPVSLTRVWADSIYWEVLSRVAPAPGTASYYTEIGSESGDAVEQPRPALSAYQGEAWSYNGDIAAYSSYTETTPGVTGATRDYQWVRVNNKIVDFGPEKAVQDIKQILASRAVSDGILVSMPYSPDRAPALPSTTPSDLLVTGDLLGAGTTSA